MRTKSRASSGLKWEVSEDGAARRPKLQCYVVSFIFTEAWRDRREVLLVRKRRPDWQKGLLNGIGGRLLSENEPDYDAASRTVREECGLDLSDQLKLFAECVWTTPPVILYCYYAISGRIYTKSSLKDEKISRYGYPEVLTRKDLVSGVSWLIPLAIDFSLKKVGEPLTVQMM